MNICRLTPSFGVHVVEANPGTLTPAELAELIREYLVVFFDPSHLDDDAQQHLLDQLGSPYIHPLGKVRGATTARCTRIVDDADHPPYQDQWHTDVTWDPERPWLGSLRAVEMPEHGGDTIWADMYAAYEGLPAALRETVEHLSAVHDMGNAMGFTSKAGGDAVAKARALYPGNELPIVGSHRMTGRRYLNVNAGFTNHVVGLPAAESAALLGQLFRHVEENAPQLRHEWKVGEFVVWDEEATQHFAVADHFPARREMARYVVR